MDVSGRIANNLDLVFQHLNPALSQRYHATSLRVHLKYVSQWVWFCL